MPDLVEQCLGLTEADARQQWRRIAARVRLPRQEAFLPVELMLCFGLFYRLNPHSFGGANIDRVPIEVRVLAETLKRTAGSITSKMLNLDGSRTNGVRQEPELFLRLGSEPDRFATLYGRAIAAARLEGLTAATVPDFLDWFELSGDVRLLGQDEIGVAEVEQILGAQATNLRDLGEAFGFDGRETARIVEQRVRLGQHRFAGQVLSLYGHRCGFCGLNAEGLSGHRLLVASHIKPWARSSDRERLDPRNGICASAIHDSAFDTGLLTVGRDLAIRRASVLEGLVRSDPGMDRFFGAGTVSERLLVPCGHEGPRGTFLDFHGREIFRG